MPRELKNLVLDEVSCVDRPANPGAKVVLLKRDTPLDETAELADIRRRIEALTNTTAPAVGAYKKEDSAVSLEDEIKKALAPSETDSDRDSDRKRLVKAQLKSGTLTPVAFAAELIIEKKAEELRKIDRTLTPAGAYAAALADPANADIVAALYS